MICISSRGSLYLCNGVQPWQSTNKTGLSAAGKAPLSVCILSELADFLLLICEICLIGGGWAGTDHFIDPTNGIALIFGVQITPASWADEVKRELFPKLEELVYAALTS